MPARLRFTILGCGASTGVPRANGDWGLCSLEERKNQRSRSSLLVERITDQGQTRVVIDTGPDFRIQMLRENIDDIDAVIYTHAHADHVNGIDDLRTFSLVRSSMIDIYADDMTFQRIYNGFSYCFEKLNGSNYIPILKKNIIDIKSSFSVKGEGGVINFNPHLQNHGNIYSLGFRIANVAYCTDVSGFPNEALQNLSGLDVLIIESLQYKSHPSHFSLDNALDWISRLAPRCAILTHMHVFLDYSTLLLKIPKNVKPAYDGMSFEYKI
ncbi:MAG: 2-cyclic phosphate phosphodiesterase [Candidatus Tokpelaia sp. JSC161]|jgi:phosphoribosyl 1,2-cyclic phosphate phosphodiesterase|nr:MAG: 2-cyclic phosphate phosphodiesterase [Candidatus Tokpelaia sp. JSC161]